MRYTLILALLCPFLSNCQPLSLKGTVINENNEPVPNATITVKRSVNAQLSSVIYQLSSNSNGEFTITNLHIDDTLIISAIGYQPQTEIYDYTLLNKPLTIILKRNTATLDEVLLIAYGTSSRRLSTGNIATVTAAQIEHQPVSNPLSALQGRVPGLVITQSSGLAGSAFNIQLRGRTTLDASLSRNDPFFIIDGIPFEPGNLASNLLNSAATNPLASSASSPGGLSPLNSINPSDIESISVLKDADATAIYGSRGANGVILITTKKAKPGRLTASVDFYSGFSKAIFNSSFLNTSQYLQMRHEAFANDALTPTVSTAPDFLLWDTTRYTNFQNLLTGNTARVYDAQASLSGGSNTTRFSIGTGYHKETTVFSNTLADARSSVHLNLYHAPLSQKWNLNLSANWSADNNHLIHTDLTKYLALPPNLRLYNSDGYLAWSDAGISYASLGFTNPLAELLQPYSSLTNNLSAGFLFNYKILSALTLRVNAGYNAFTTNETSNTPKAAIDPALSTLASSSFATSARYNWIMEPQAEYNAAIAKGKLNALVGTTFQHNEYSNTSISATGYTSDLLLNALSAAASISASNYKSLYRYQAVFGRLTYNWMQKYLFNLSARRDGSSRFGPGNRFASFGSMAGGWIFSSEPFIKNSLPFLSFGKLRSSYGLTGNDQIGDYKYLDLWAVTTNPYAGTPGLRPSALFNPYFEWEKNKKLEAALDLGFWEDRLLLSLAWYRNRSSNQLVSYLLPNQTGFASVVKNLPAVVENRGWEITADLNLALSQNFHWNAGFNLTLPSNKLVSFPGLSTSSYYAQYVEGASLTVQSKLKFLGVDGATGLYGYDDYNKDGSISTPADLQITGDLDPDFYGGLSNTFTYKSFTFDFFFQFAKQTGTNYLAYQSSTPPGFLYNQPSLVLARWQQPGDVTGVQKFGATPASAVFIPATRLSASDAIYSDASYIRLKNASLSWNLPASWLQKAKLQNLKLYAEAQNILTITRYKGSDPETQNLFRLPPLKTIAFGIKLNL